MSGEAFFKAQSVRVSGGCLDCNADQALEETAPGVWKLTVRHDPTCPWLTQNEAAS